MKGENEPTCPDCDYSCRSLPFGKPVCPKCGQVVARADPKSKRWHNDGVLVDIGKVQRGREQ